ncbi:MAG: pyridoxamine 5'-phosphate oxidase family protein [Acidimicrobiia bacterium]
MGWRDDDRVLEVLDEGDLLYVAVSSRRGPHVTPTVFDRDRGRLVFVTPRRSVKARVIARRRRVGALVHFEDRAVMMLGRARIVDPLTARGVFSGNDLLDLPLAAAGFLARNRRQVTDTMRDHQAPTLVLSRVAVSIEITRVALLQGHRVLAHWGRWPDVDRLLPGTPNRTDPPDVSGAPPALRSFLAGRDRPGVLGWQTPAGPVALPAWWRRETGEAEVSAAALVLAGAGPEAPACLTVDRSRYRSRHQQGVLLAGTGHVRVEDGVARVALAQERLTWWDGEDSGTKVVAGTGDGQARTC